MPIDFLVRSHSRRHGFQVGTLTLLCTVVMVAGCSKAAGEGASQVVASVNGDEVTESQVSLLLQRQSNLKADQIDAASRRAVQTLVQQEVVLRKARELKLDRDQQVVQAVESLKREIIAKAYLDRIAEGATRPSPKDIRSYYDANPVLFGERRVYTFQEVSVDADESQKKDIEKQLTGMKTPAELDAFLKGRQIPAKTSRSTVGPESIPLPLLPRIAVLKPGQGLIVPTPGGLRILMLLGAENSPVGEEQAGPAISAFLLNQRKQAAVEQEVTALRSSSKVEFFGKYADLAASAPSSPPAGTLPTPPDATHAANDAAHAVDPASTNPK